MAMLASKASFPATLGSGSSTMPSSLSPAAVAPTRRAPTIPAASQQSFASPTESEFSEDDSPDSVKNWDEDRVGEYLRSVKCGEYEKMFRKNHINGENLLEMDKEVLKEMGIDKVGDRVRLFLSIKKLRTKAYANQKKRNRVRAFWPLSIHRRSANAAYRIPLAVSTFSTRHPRAPPGRRPPPAGPCPRLPQTSAIPGNWTCRACWTPQSPTLGPTRPCRAPTSAQFGRATARAPATAPPPLPTRRGNPAPRSPAVW